MTHAHLRDAVEPGEVVPVSPKMFSKIVRNNLSKKNRPETSKRAVPQVWKERIADHWRSLSRVSPHEMFVVKRRSKNNPQTQCIEKYYQQYPLKEAWARFQQTYPDFPFKICTYRDGKPSNVKKPKSRQDACPTCKEAKQFQTALEGAHGQNCSSDDIEALEAYKFHKKIRDARYEDYERQLESLKPREALLVIDFKANITLGKGPVEDSHVVFSAPQRTVFGGAAFFRSGTGERYKVMFTIISAVNRHDSKTLLEILRGHIFKHPIWNHFNVKKTSIWMDNARQHFRNYETFATFFQLGQELKQDFELNFFAEYHGKFECDRHFGLISRLYKEATRYGASNTITTTGEWMDMYTSGIRGVGGHILSPEGGFYEELLPMAEKKVNAIITEFKYEGQDQYLEELERNGTSEEKKNPTLTMSYLKRQLNVSPIVKDGKAIPFCMDLYYKFRFIKDTTGGWWITAKLTDGSAKTDFRCSVRESQVSNYTVPLGAATSQKRKYSTIKKVVRRRRYHEEDDFGQAETFFADDGE